MKYYFELQQHITINMNSQYSILVFLQAVSLKQSLNFTTKPFPATPVDSL